MREKIANALCNNGRGDEEGGVGGGDTIVRRVKEVKGKKGF